MYLHAVDWVVIAIYFAIVLSVGVMLKRAIKTSGDFLMAGRSVQSWVAGLAFLSANLGAQEVIGMGASGAKYGIATAHFYWLGALPAMVFVGLFMMPFYYGSRARSVPEYLRLRFDEKTRALNALTFAVMTIFSSGISMYAMAKLLQALHIFDALFVTLGLSTAWVFHVSILVCAVVVLCYTFTGGLRGAIYNEVLQFFLIVAGFFPLVCLGLKDAGGWKGLVAKLPDPRMAHVWAGMAHPQGNLIGVDWFGMTMGLGFVLSFGYWCTDFLVVQRAMAADSMDAARRVPLIAAVPKMLMPFLVILPGMIAMSKGLVPVKLTLAGQPLLGPHGAPVLDYDLATPMMLLHYFPPGILGLGLTALLASFMSGMAGNVTAFNTVWTYDIYQAYLKPKASDKHYLWVGHAATVAGVLGAIGAAYLCAGYNNIMDVLQLLFAFVNAPLFATFLLGMFWKRSTGHGAFVGLTAGILAAALHHGLTLPLGAVAGFKGGWIACLHTYPSEMAGNFWTAIWAWSTCFAVTIAVSLATAPRPEKELVGLVYSLTEKPKDLVLPWYRRPVTLGLAVLTAGLVLNLIFW